MKLLTVYDDKNSLNNVLIALSINIDEVFYFYHHDIKETNINNIDKVLNNHKVVKTNFIKLENDEEEIEKIIADNNDLIIDVGGVKYLSLVLFELGLKYNIQLLYFNFEDYRIADYINHLNLNITPFKLNVEDVLLLTGGKITNILHEPIEDEDTKQIIIKTVENNLENYSSFTNTIQKLNNILLNSKEINESTYELSNNNIHNIKTENYINKLNLLFELKDNQLIFKTEKTRSLLYISGSFLENYLYYKIKDSNLFDDFLMSVEIDFASEKYKGQVKCEIDALAIKDNHLLFISAKSNKIDTYSVNEIYTHNKRFGNTLSYPILCTLQDLDLNSSAIYAKAKELEVAVLDRTNFINNDLTKQMINVINDCFEYEKSQS